MHGIAPEEYKCEKLFPFFYAKGSTVLMLVSFEDGNWVKPVFLITYSYFLITLIPGFGIDIGFTFLETGTVGFKLFFCILFYKELFM